MKNKNYFKKAILLFLVCSIQFITAQVPNYVPTNGLVAYYPFNGNANDASGNNNNGTVNGATLTTDRFGNANSAYSFDGISNYINIANSILPSTSTSLTISLWFLSADTDAHLILDRSGATNTSKYGITLNLNSSNQTVLSAGGENGNCTGTCACFSSSISPSATTWNNVILVKDLSLNTEKLYLNGILIANRNTFCYTNFTSPTAIGRGNSYYAPYGDGYTNGKIDDVGIWNRALTEAEITTIYNGVTYTDTCTGLNGTLLNGLAAYYPFCGNANDQSGNGHNGTVTGATLTTDRFGNPNSAYYFDGSSSYIYAGNISSLTNTSTSSTTVSFWMNSNSLLGINSDLFDLRSTDNSAFQVYTNNNNNPGRIEGNSYNASISNGFSTISPNTLSNNQWYNVVYVTNNSTGHAILYVNGIQVADVTGSIGLLTNPKLNIGSRYDAFNSRCCYFKGAIDDVCFWNRALTQTEITNLFNANICYQNITVTDTLVINVGQMGFNPATYANNITIYPNPASTQVNISFNTIADLSGGTIKIINALGQQVATTPITATGTNTTMTLSTWGGAGLYFVQIVNPQGQIVDIKKILLQ